MHRAVPLLLFLVACEEEPTQLVVAVQTDLVPLTEIDAFRVSVESEDGRSVRALGRRRGDYWAPIEVHGSSFPATFGVAPFDRDPERTVTVRVTAQLAGADLFETRAVTSFVENERLRLDLFLAGSCRALACLPEETCTARGCVAPEVPPGNLPAWDGQVPPIEGLPQGSWRRLVAWTEDEGSAATVEDVVSLPDRVWILGTFLGRAMFEGAGEVTVEREALWLSCYTLSGDHCGLTVLGGTGGTLTGPHAAAEASGTLLVVGTFSAAPTVGSVTLDTHGAQAAGFILRGTPPFDPADLEVVTVAASGGDAKLLGVTATSQGPVLLSGWAETPWLDFYFEAPGPSSGFAMPTAGVFHVLTSAGLGIPSAVATPGTAYDPVSAFASGRVVRASAALQSLETAVWDLSSWNAGESLPLPTLGREEVSCSAVAEAPAGAEDVWGRVCTGDGTAIPEGDLWVSLRQGTDPPTAVASAVEGGTGEEVVTDAAGDERGMVCAGHFEGETRIPGAVLRANGPRDAMVFRARAQGSDVTIEWLGAVSTAGDDDARGVTIDDAGGVVVVGQLGGALGEIGNATNSSQVYAQRFGPTP